MSSGTQYQLPLTHTPCKDKVRLIMACTAYWGNTLFSLQYRIGQLYMIARHSADESKGSGDGVETVINKPCSDDEHGEGFYAEKKIYLTRL